LLFLQISLFVPDPWHFYMGLGTSYLPAAFPYMYYAPAAPACSFVKKELKRKSKNNKIEFQCACEKERASSQRCGRTKHSNECKMKRLKESIVD
jgi:hypothetical protein